MTNAERDQMMAYISRLHVAGNKMIVANKTGNWYDDAVQEWQRTVAEVLAQIVVHHG